MIKSVASAAQPPGRLELRGAHGRWLGMDKGRAAQLPWILFFLVFPAAALAADVITILIFYVFQGGHANGRHDNDVTLYGIWGGLR